MRTQLTWEQRLRVAVAHYCNGVDQEVISELVGVNIGRIHEACIVLRIAAEDPKGVRKVLKQSGKFPEA